MKNKNTRTTKELDQREEEMVEQIKIVIIEMSFLSFLLGALISSFITTIIVSLVIG